MDDLSIEDNPWDEEDDMRSFGDYNLQMGELYSDEEDYDRELEDAYGDEEKSNDRE